MKKLSATFVLLFLAVFAFAQTEYTINFNAPTYTENAALNGQDNWVSRAHSAGGGVFKTEYLGAGGNITPDETMGLFFDNANTNFGEIATHKSTDNFHFDFSEGGIIEIELEMLSNWWGLAFGIGYDADGDGVVLPPMTYEAVHPNPSLPSQDGGIYFVKTGVDPRPTFATGIVLPDNTMPVELDCGAGGWNRWKIMIDLEANDGAGSVTLFADYGVTGEFEPVPEIQGVNAGLTPGSGDRFDPAKWDGVFILNSSLAGYDNLVIRHTPAGLASQFIDFANIPDKLTFDQPFQLQATATSGLPVSFELIEGPASLDGNTVTLNGQEGVVKIKAIQPGDGIAWQPAPNVTRTFEVVNPNNFTPEIVLRRPYDGTKVYMSELHPIMLVLSAYVEHGDVIRFNEVKCTLDGEDILLHTDYPNNPENGYWYASWTPTSFGTYSMTASITQSGGKVTTVSNTFEVTNNFNDIDVVTMNGDLIVSPSQQTVQGEYAMPTHVDAFNSIIAHYDHRCVATCDTYDRVGYIRVKNHRGEWVELFRYVTPFGVECEDNVDVTDYQTVLQGLVEFEMFFQTWNGSGYNPILTFNMTKGTPDYLYTDIQPLWFGAYDFGDYANQQPVPTVDYHFIPTASAAKLKIMTSGHNWSSGTNNCNNTGNAAEFYEATHHVLVNGQNKYDQHLWRQCTPNPAGCQPQNGTWTYSRSGWCPGSIALVWDFDLTEYMAAGSANLFYQFDPTYLDLCHPNHPDCVDGQTCTQCSAADNPILRVSGSVVSYSNDENMLWNVNTYPSLNEDPFSICITPNPAKDNMTLSTDYESGKLCVHIMNMQGQEVRNFVMRGTTTIDISDLPAGIYFVNAIGGKVITKKVVIE